MYWEKAGRANTEQTVELAIQRAKELGIRYVVVAFDTKVKEIICKPREF